MLAQVQSLPHRQNTSRPAPLVISGPSGVGKSYLANYLTRTYFCQRILPTTTRPPRMGEQPGKDYDFLTTDQYHQYQKEGRFFMSNFFFGNYYGIERRQLKKLCVKASYQ